LAIGAAPAANAQSTSESARVLDALKKLDARLAAIEGRLDRKATDHTKAEVRAIRNQLGQPTFAAAQPREAYAADPGMGVRSITPLPTTRWAGFYVGASAGSTWLDGNYDRLRTGTRSTIDREFQFGALDAETPSVFRREEAARLKGHETGAVL
jgi:hypothetical protein